MPKNQIFNSCKFERLDNSLKWVPSPFFFPFLTTIPQGHSVLLDTVVFFFFPPSEVSICLAQLSFFQNLASASFFLYLIILMPLLSCISEYIPFPHFFASGERRKDLFLWLNYRRNCDHTFFWWGRVIAIVFFFFGFLLLSLSLLFLYITRDKRRKKKKKRERERE